MTFLPERSRAGESAADRIVARGEAHVWWWRCPERTDPADLALLGTDEFHRALGMLAERDAAEFVGSRARARRALGALLQLPPEQVELGRQQCPGCGGTGHGPPQLVRPPLPLSVSLSRTAGWGVLALGAGARIGVDAEALRPVHDAVFTGSVLTPAEREHLDALAPGEPRHRAFHRIWTRKESVVKAVGVGLTGTDLDRLDTRPADEGPVHLVHRSAGDTTHWTVEDLPLSPDLAVALARPRGPASRGRLHLHPPAA
ncbi:4'-phosphopantetheinyl transferase superfamily protein [Streptomyces sp. SID8379]|uniref:4'-phosphopantetheinyl transferase family protein n=1 Tax=unclassified Streptomyces TaxID=2593676 RepID=UPI00036643B9|nr:MULTISPECIES: 4'-phosphopantetheinyl transferase superfamily protein [unclassified Streptomyces]MYW67604.1 4'-phosphopantetheinyl transferase superfamily protein [Streptomyces sp. SID8379]